MSDFTKGLPCPNCDKTANFQGGSYGSGINTTNIKCDCGFTAFVILTRSDFEYEVRAELKDRKKANPYKDKPKDQLIIEKHYIKECLDKTSNFGIIRESQKALSFINDILKES